VADEDDGRAGVTDALDEAHDERRLRNAQGGCGLIHDHHVAAPKNRARDRDGLALAARKRIDALIDRSDLHAERIEVGLGARPHPPHVHNVQQTQDAGPAQLAAQEQIAGHIQIRCERQVLIDRFDAGLPRVARAAEVDRIAAHEQRPRIG
jgi:hypothetical protein